MFRPKDETGVEAGKLLKGNPDIHEMVNAMVENPVLKYELLADYQRFKARNHDQSAASEKKE